MPIHARASAVKNLTKSLFVSSDIPAPRISFDAERLEDLLHPELLAFMQPQKLWLENGYLTTSSFTIKDSWKEKKRNWGHSMHAMASRSGSFPPALASYFIDKFSKSKQTVLDPFSGKGTTALEACLNDRVGVGLDVAPEAYILTAAKTVNISHSEAVKYLESLNLEKEFKKLNSKKIKSLIKDIPEEVKVFYHDKTLAQIVLFREKLLEDYSLRHVSYLNEQAPQHELDKKTLNAKCAQYWKGVIMGILHGSSDISLSVSCSHSFSMSPGYVKNYSKKHGLEKPERDLIDCLIKRSERLQGDKSPKNLKGRALLGSAMALPKNLKEKIDLIVTSPPYFTAQTYAWDNWLREWFLGFDFKDVRTKTLHTNVEDKYRQGMNEHLAESYKALKKGSWSFVVVGDVIKKINNGRNKKHIVTADIIAEEAMKVGFSVELIINDDIPPTSRYNSAFLKKNQGLKLDRIVCLYKS